MLRNHQTSYRQYSAIVGFYRVYRDIALIIENQMNKKVGNEMETGIMSRQYAGKGGHGGSFGSHV